MFTASRISAVLWLVLTTLWLVVATAHYRNFHGYLAHTGQLLPFLVQLAMASGAAYQAYASQKRCEALRTMSTTFGVVSLIYEVMLLGLLPSFGLMPNLLPFGIFGLLVPAATCVLAFITAVSSAPRDSSDEIPHRVRDSF